MAGLVGAVGACGGTAETPTDPHPSTPAAVVTETGASIRRDGDAVIATPKERNGRAVVYVHGAGQNGMAILEQALRAEVAAKLLDEGFVVAAADAGGKAWGNASSVRRYRGLVAELRAAGARRVYVLAESMGGLAGFQIADAVDGVAAWYPVCDVRTLEDDARFKFDIDAAWGRAERDAVEPLAMTGLSGKPVELWASPEDSLVPKHSNADVCAARARAAGARVTLHETRGEHGDPSNFDAQAILEAFSG